MDAEKLLDARIERGAAMLSKTLERQFRFVGEREYRVRSSKDKEWYTVLDSKTLGYLCECDDFVYRGGLLKDALRSQEHAGECKHIIALQKALPLVRSVLEMKPMQHCVSCDSEKVVRHGVSADGRQRYLCKNERCGKSFYAQTDAAKQAG